MKTLWQTCVPAFSLGHCRVLQNFLFSLFLIFFFFGKKCQELITRLTEVSETLIYGDFSVITELMVLSQ